MADRAIYAPDAQLKTLVAKYRGLYPDDNFVCRALEAWQDEGEPCDEVLLYPGPNADRLRQFYKDRVPQWNGKPVKLTVCSDRSTVAPPKADKRPELRPEQMTEVAAIMPQNLPNLVELPNDHKVQLRNYVTAAIYSNGLSKEQWNALDDEQRRDLVLQEIHKQWPEWKPPASTPKKPATPKTTTKTPQTKKSRATKKE